MTPAGLAKIETRLLVKITDAERRARPRPSSPVLAAVLDGGDVRERWAEMSISVAARGDPGRSCRSRSTGPAAARGTSIRSRLRSRGGDISHTMGPARSHSCVTS